jgi:hypothetical protein
MLLTVAGMVSVMNSIVIAVLVGGLFERLAPDLTWLWITAGGLTFAAAVVVHQRIQTVRRSSAPTPFG